MSGKGSCNGTLIVGIVAIIAGTVLMLDRIGLIHGSQVFRLWPLILIAIGTNTLIQSRGRGHIVGGGMLLLAGILNLLFVFHCPISFDLSSTFFISTEHQRYKQSVFQHQLFNILEVARVFF